MLSLAFMLRCFRRGVCDVLQESRHRVGRRRSMLTGQAAGLKLAAGLVFDHACQRGSLFLSNLCRVGRSRMSRCNWLYLGRCRMANAPTSRSSPAMPIRHRLAGLIAVAGRAGVLASSGIRGKKSGEQTNPLICQLPRYDSASLLRWFSARSLSGRSGHSAHLDRCSSRPCRWRSPCAFRGRPESHRRYRVKLSGGTCLFQFLRYPMNFTCWTTR